MRSQSPPKVVLTVCAVKSTFKSAANADPTRQPLEVLLTLTLSQAGSQ